MSATPNLWAVVQRMIDTALAVRCPYGIDDVYVTFSNTEPTARWPGTSWERITDCFLLAADSTHPAGSTGGAWEVVQTVEQMPTHSHSTFQIGIAYGSVEKPSNGVSTMRSAEREDTSGAGLTERTAGAGGGQPMNITNKYTAVYMYKRTS